MHDAQEAAGRPAPVEVQVLGADLVGDGGFTHLGLRFGKTGHPVGKRIDEEVRADLDQLHPQAFQGGSVADGDGAPRA